MIFTMNIDLDMTEPVPTPQLLQPSDFTSFKVVVHGIDRIRARSALASVASWVDEDHVAVPADTLRSLAGDAALDAAWEDGFAKMLAYAATKGWMVDGAIRAHVEWDA